MSTRFRGGKRHLPSGPNKYWEKSTFYLDRLSKDMYTWPSDHEIIDNLHERELKLIRKSIVTYDCEDEPVKWHLTTRRNNMKG